MSDETTHEPERLLIDLEGEGITARLLEAPVYRAYTPVWAQPAGPGATIIRTFDDDGNFRSAVALPGIDDWVLSNEAGERWLLSDKVFRERCFPTNVEGVYVVFMGWVRALPNPEGRPVAALSATNEYIMGDEDCMLVMEVGGKHFDQPTARRYFVGAGDFAASHALYEIEPGRFARLRAAVAARIGDWLHGRLSAWPFGAPNH